MEEEIKQEQVEEQIEQVEEQEEVKEETIKENTEEKEVKETKELNDWVKLLLLAFLTVFVLMTCFFRLASVEGSSMYPTLKEREVLVISNFLYTPKQGDIIVVQQSNLETRVFNYPIVKRVIATGGQTVNIDFDNWIVTVDGIQLEEEYVNKVAGTMKRLDMKENTFTVPEGYVFVMGDNRNGSTDSRYSKIGFLRNDEVVGKAVLRIMPFTILK